MSYKYRSKYLPTKKSEKEVELGIKLTNWLDYHEVEHWQEVKTRHGIIDCVAKTKTGKYVALETKITLNFAVLGQGLDNRKYCDYSVVVVKQAHKSKGRLTARKVLDDYGIGLIQIRSWKGILQNISRMGESEELIDLDSSFSIKPKLTKRKKDAIESLLFDEQKESIAGEESGSVSTEFKRTMQSISDYILELGPQFIADIFDNVPHHYKKMASLKKGMDLYSDHLYLGEDGRWYHDEDGGRKKEVSRWKK